MDYRSWPRRTSAAVALRLAVGLAGLLLLGLGLLFGRELEWFLLKCSLRSKFRDERWITTRQLADWLADRQRPAPVLLDVRTPAEWEVSHLPGARRVDPQANAKTTAGDLAKDAPIVTYCAVGYRSARWRTGCGPPVTRRCRISKARFSNGRTSIGRSCMGRARHEGAPIYELGRLLAPEVRAALPKVARLPESC